MSKRNLDSKSVITVRRWHICIWLTLAIAFGVNLLLAQTGRSKPVVTSTGRAIFKIASSGEQQEIKTAFSGARINKLVIDEQNPDHLYAATEKGLFFSSDGGGSWIKLNIGEETEVFAAAATKGKLLISTRQGLLVGRYGSNWERLKQGLPKGLIALTIEVSRSNKDVIYIGTEAHGVFKSTNGGRRWQTASNGLPEAVGAAPVTAVEHLVIDPKNTELVYASTEVNGIYKTSDGGRTWKAVNKGLPGLFPFRTYQPLLAIDEKNRQTIYALIGYPVHSHLIVNKLFRSTDGGENWRAVLKLGDNRIFRSMIINPSDPTELLLGTEEKVLRIKLPAATTLEPSDEWEMVESLSSTGASLAQDVGDIAVLIDEGRELAHLFDLNKVAIRFVPAGSGYRVLRDGSFTFNSELGTKLTLRDEDGVKITLPFTFTFYGTSQTEVFVNSNGNLTFGARDTVRGPSININSFALRSPRITPLWVDLDPSAAKESGGVFVNSVSDRVVVTWKEVPEARKTNANTFQVVILPDGTMMFSYDSVASISGIVGTSPGGADPSTVTLIKFSLARGRPFRNVPIAENFDGEFNIQAIGRKFYETHPDNFDFLVAWGASSMPPGVADGAFAFYEPIKNDVRGIGLPSGQFFGGPVAFGSDGRLQGFLNMNRLSEYPNPPNFRFTFGVLGQEAGHRWAAFVRFKDGSRNSDELLGRALAHWSFYHDTDASAMEGNDWRDNGDGTFTSVDVTSRYSKLDQYLMGLRPPEEVSSFFFIRNPSPSRICFDPSLQGRDCPPRLGAMVSGTRVDVSVNQVIEAEGPRTSPLGQAPTSFTQAFMLVVPPGSSQEAIRADIEKLDQIRQAWEEFFNRATDGRGTVVTRLK